MLSAPSTVPYSFAKNLGNCCLAQHFPSCPGFGGGHAGAIQSAGEPAGICAGQRDGGQQRAAAEGDFGGAAQGREQHQRRQSEPLRQHQRCQPEPLTPARPTVMMPNFLLKCDVERRTRDEMLLQRGI